MGAQALTQSNASLRDHRQFQNCRPMETNAITSTVHEITSTLVPLGGFIAVLFGFAWVVYRTRSAHALRRRVWGLIFGKAHLTDDLIKNFVDERTNLMSFRFIAGVNVRTLQQAHDLIEWLRANNEEVSSVRAIQPYFDLERMDVAAEKLPRKAWIYALLAFFLTAALVTAVPIYGIGYDKVILRMKKSGTYFVVKETTAELLSLSLTKAVALTQEDCALPISARTSRDGFRPDEIPAVCELLSNASTSDYLRSTLLQQRLASGLLATLALFILYLPGRSLNQISEARQLLDRQKSRRQQLSLDLR